MQQPTRARRRIAAVPFALFAITVATTACTPSVVRDSREWATPGRMAVDAPARFITTDPADVDGAPASGCASRLVDRRYGVELSLVRASASHESKWRGDYRASVPARYDVAEGELVRVECATGVPIGVVGGAALASDARPAPATPR